MSKEVSSQFLSLFLLLGFPPAQHFTYLGRLATCLTEVEAMDTKLALDLSRDRRQCSGLQDGGHDSMSQSLLGKKTKSQRTQTMRCTSL